MKENPSSQLHLGPNGREIFDGYNKKGEWYRIVHGCGGGWVKRRRCAEGRRRQRRTDLGKITRRLTALCDGKPDPRAGLFLHHRDTQLKVEYPA